MSYNKSNNKKENDQINLWILLNKFWYYKIHIAVSVLIFIILGIIYFYSTSPKYEVDASFRLRNDNESSLLSSLEFLPFLGSGNSKVRYDEMAQLSSRDLVRQIVKDKELQVEYRKKKGLYWQGQYPNRDIQLQFSPILLDTIRHKVKVNIIVGKEKYNIKFTSEDIIQKFQVTTLDEPLSTAWGDISFKVNKQLQKGDKYRIKIVPLKSAIEDYQETYTVDLLQKESYIIVLSTTTDMPRLAIDCINQQLDLYVKMQTSDKAKIVQTTSQFIDDRLVQVKAELEEIEDKVEQYRKDNNITDLSTESVLYLNETSLSRRRAQEMSMQLKIMDYIEESISTNDALLPANLGISDESLAALVMEYNQQVLKLMRLKRTATEKSPIITDLNLNIQTLRQNIKASISTNRESLKVQLTELKGNEQRNGKYMANLPTTERELIEMERQLKLIESIYLLLFQKREENALSAISSNIPIHIVTTAQSYASSVAPNIKKILLISIVLGLLLPILIIYAVSLLANRIQSVQEAQTLLQVPIVGYLSNNKNKSKIAISAATNDKYAEQFRVLRTNIMHTLPNAKSMLVCSGTHGEGKTYVALNTAIAFALLGKKTIVVDLDLKQDNRSTNGLAMWLSNSNDVPIADIISHSEHSANVDIIKAGSTNVNPRDIVDNVKLTQLFDYLREHYDYIIIDTTPLCSAYTLLLNSFADLALVVCRLDHTSESTVNRINQLYFENTFSQMLSVINS